MSTLDANLALLSTIPEDRQEEIKNYLLMNFFKNNPYKPLSINEILDELSASRKCYENGEGEDFDDAIEAISVKYGL